MKNFISKIAVLLLVTNIAYAGKVPEIVKKAFNQKFKGATHVQWEKENTNEWEANFEFQGHKMSANYTNNGEWLETETTLSVSELPKEITDAVKKKYPKAIIKEADRVGRINMGLQYEVEIKTGQQVKGLILDEKGNFIN